MLSVRLVILGEPQYFRIYQGFFCPFPEKLCSYRLSENDSWPFFGTQNEIFDNPKTDIKFLISRKFELAILLKNSEGIKGHPNR